MKVGCYETHNLALGSRLRQQVLIRVDHIGKLHAVAIRELARSDNMAFHIDGPLAVGQDRCHMDAVTILHPEGCDPFHGRRWCARGG